MFLSIYIFPFRYEHESFKSIDVNLFNIYRVCNYVYIADSLKKIVTKAMNIANIGSDFFNNNSEKIIEILKNRNRFFFLNSKYYTRI